MNRAGQFGYLEGVPMAIDPAIWSKLPEELLVLVFARLPLRELFQLRSEAMVEHWHIDLNNSGFDKLCAQSHSNLCPVVSYQRKLRFAVCMHDGESSFRKPLFLSGEVWPLHTICSSDGGLVCFALTFLPEKVKEGGLRLMFVVVNPLTERRRRLPGGHGVSPFQLKMMQLVMDRNTGCYQVILVHGKHGRHGEAAHRNEPPPYGAVRFDSRTGVWSKVMDSSQILLGPTVHEADYVMLRTARVSNQVNRDVTKMDNCGKLYGPSAYDCSTGEVLYIEHEGFNALPGDSFDFVLIKDHAFLLALHRTGDGKVEYTLSEHQVEVRGDKLRWTTLNEDLFGPNQGLMVNGYHEESYLRLFGCEGFLLVAGSHKRPVDSDDSDDPSDYEDSEVEREEYVEEEVAVLYNLARRKWIDLIPSRWNKSDGYYFGVFGKSPVFLCELQWDAVP